MLNVFFIAIIGTMVVFIFQIALEIAHLRQTVKYFERNCGFKNTHDGEQ